MHSSATFLQSRKFIFTFSNAQLQTSNRKKNKIIITQQQQHDFNYVIQVSNALSASAIFKYCVSNGMS